MTRDDFMDFFRDDEKLNTLSNDDRIEIFRTILAGSSDITVELLNELLGDYNVDDISISKIAPQHLLLRRRQLSAKKKFDPDNFTKDESLELQNLTIEVSDYNKSEDELFDEFIHELDKLGGLSAYRKCKLTGEEKEVRRKQANTLLEKIKQQRIDNPERYY
jgi:putative ubiquitin-RnfH superfamily antitoxin RatB of RatAB toxin-antitoxin module